VQVLRGTLVVAALLLAMGILAAFLLPDDINPFRRRTVERQPIGVPVGVPDASSSPPSQPTNPAPLVANEPATTGEPTTAGADQNVAPTTPTTGQEQTSNSQSVTPATSPSAANANASTSTLADNSGQEQGASSAQASVAPQAAAATESNSVAKKQRTAGSTTLGRRGRARVVGITSDGRLIFRLPSGRTAIVAPDSDEDQIAPRRQRRLRMERGQIVSPPSFSPNYSPDD
jgi:hypothetical protein